MHMPKFELTLADASLENVEKYEMLTIPILFAKDHYTLSNSEHVAVLFVGE